MRIDILTLFPEMCSGVYSQSIIGRAINKNIIEIHSHNIRDYSRGKHKSVDDTPYIISGEFSFVTVNIVPIATG